MTPTPYGKKYEKCVEFLFHLVAQPDEPHPPGTQTVPDPPRNDRPFDVDDPYGWRDHAPDLPDYTSLYRTSREIDPLTLGPLTEWTKPELVGRTSAPQEEMELA